MIRTMTYLEIIASDDGLIYMYDILQSHIKFQYVAVYK